MLFTALEVPFLLPSPPSPIHSPPHSPKPFSSNLDRNFPKSPKSPRIPKSPLLRKTLSSPNPSGSPKSSIFTFPNKDDVHRDTTSPDSALGSSVAGDSSEATSNSKSILSGFNKSNTLPLSRVVSSPPSYSGSQPGSPSSLMVGRAITAVAAAAAAPQQLSASTRTRSISVNSSLTNLPSDELTPSSSTVDITAASPENDGVVSPSDKVWTPNSYNPNKKEEPPAKPHIPKALAALGDLTTAFVETVQVSPSPKSKSGSSTNLSTRPEASINRSESLSEKRSSMDEWEKKLFNRSGSE